MEYYKEILNKFLRSVWLKKVAKKRKIIFGISEKYFIYTIKISRTFSVILTLQLFQSK